MYHTNFCAGKDKGYDFVMMTCLEQSKYEIMNLIGRLNISIDNTAVIVIFSF